MSLQTCCIKWKLRHSYSVATRIQGSESGPQFCHQFVALSDFCWCFFLLLGYSLGSRFHVFTPNADCSIWRMRADSRRVCLTGEQITSSHNIPLLLSSMAFSWTSTSLFPCEPLNHDCCSPLNCLHAGNCSNSKFQQSWIMRFPSP